ncbi:MAG: hypothetical protein NT047_09595 [Deltaproteobacteria bacterium]|nr:hypothetical protein [Deltaproteobacteria bacterium]
MESRRQAVCMMPGFRGRDDPDTSGTTWGCRFGFSPASRNGLACQWEGVPDGAFMALILDEAVMAGVSGVARYRVEFGVAL